MSGYGDGFGYPNPYGLDPLELEDVVQEGLDRLFEFYKERPNLRTLLIILLARWQAFEDASGQILLELDPATARGWWLDNVFGPMVDLRRRTGWSDETYRFFIATKQLAYRSSGTAPQLLAVARRMIPETTDPTLVRFLPQYPKGYRMEIPDVPADLQGLAAELMAIATSATDRGHLVFYSSTSNFHSFRAPGTVHGFGVGTFANGVHIVGTP